MSEHATDFSRLADGPDDEQSFRDALGAVHITYDKVFAAFMPIDPVGWRHLARNPAARSRFPDLEGEGLDHPIYQDIMLHAEGSEDWDKLHEVFREVVIGETSYEQRILHFDEGDLIRDFSKIEAGKFELELVGKLRTRFHPV